MNEMGRSRTMNERNENKKFKKIERAHLYSWGSYKTFQKLDRTELFKLY